MADLLIPGVGKVSDFPEVAGSDLLLPGGGLVANDYVAAGGNVMLLLLNNTLGGDANRMTSME